ncbi:Tethering factor for nuclear proteasome sts1 [Tieghemiomyces parasiticus]|uniref:Tethering factor for nuclear proteasome STS1 n=1 Tax=Tieghemiomyces parasiticus TaxID=78921 RepID=A0A9W8ABK2_9FUNG|nr:Tethering factor for nuclear proteasome sts1 [Tieghemiomyces parasiticus]
MAHFVGQSPCLRVPSLLDGTVTPLSPFNSPASLANCGAFASLVASPLGCPADTMIRGTKRKPDEDEDDDMMSRSPSPGARTLSETGTAKQPWKERVAHARRQQNPAHRERSQPASPATPFKHKRTRHEDDSPPNRLPLAKLLEPLNREQLVGLFGKLLERHPELEDDLAGLAPRPTLQTVTTALAAQRKALYDSFPYTKWGPATDSYSFHRVRPQLDELRDSLLQYANHFTSEQEFPTTTFAYLQQAAEIALHLPVWDTTEHNALRSELLESLSNYYQKAIRSAAVRLSEGKLYGQQTIEEWGRGLQQHVHESQGQYFSSALTAFAQCFGWLLGGPVGAAANLTFGSPRGQTSAPRLFSATS